MFLLQVAGLSGHQGRDQPDHVRVSVADGADLGEQFAHGPAGAVGKDGHAAQPFLDDVTLGPGVQVPPRRVLDAEDSVGVRLAQRPDLVPPAGELLPADGGQAAHPAGPAGRRHPLHPAAGHGVSRPRSLMASSST
jgi:hypothetical protein